MEFKVGDRVITIQNSILHEGIIKNIRNNDSICEVSLDGYNIILVTSIDNISRITKEKTTLENLEQRIEKLEKEVFKPVEIHDSPKETKPSLLTEDERVILSNLEDDYKWIVRDETGWLTIHEMYPYINNHHNWVSNGDSNFFDLFNHIFQFIKWGDKPYNIEELLKGECGNE